MKKTLLCCMALVGCLFASCEKGGEKGPDLPPPTNPEADLNIVLNTCAQTSYVYAQEEGASDAYMMLLASGKTIFDENTGLFRTEDDGYVMIVSLYADPVDPTKPHLPAGKYNLSSGTAPGTWSNAEGANMIISYTEETGAVTLLPESGSVDVEEKDGKYFFKALFDLNDGKNCYTTYEGELKFTGKSGTIDEDAEVEFIDGQALYLGDYYGFGCGLVRFEFWENEAEEELGPNPGYLVKCELNVPLHNYDNGPVTLPTGTFEFSFTVEEGCLNPGYDDGVSIPTGCYVSYTEGVSSSYAMFSSGTLTITQNGHAIVDMQTDDWVTIKGTLNKALQIFDLSGGPGGGEEPEGPFSTLKEDYVIDYSGASTAWFLDYGDYFQNGTRNVVLQVLDGQNLRGMLFDLVFPAGEEFSPLPDGILQLDGTAGFAPEAFTYQPGFYFDGPGGSWGLVGLGQEGETFYYDMSSAAPASGGTISIKRNGEQYTITLDLLDDAETPHRITGSWTGTLTPTSYNSPAASVMGGFYPGLPMKKMRQL